MRICFFGDSFVNGTGDDACLGWTGRLCAAARQAGHDITHYNLGVRRDTSADIAARWLAEAEARLPQDIDGRLVFAFGANDAADDGHGRPRLTREQTLTNAQAILTAAKAWRPTLMIGPPPLSDPAADARLRALSQDLAQLCAGLAVPFLDVSDSLGASPWTADAVSGDGAHPNRGGYAALAAVIGAWAGWRAWF